MKKVFWDTNIVLDLMLARKPWDILAAQIYSQANMNNISLYCSTISLATLSYFLERERIPVSDIFGHIESFISVCEPTIVDINTAKSALKSSFKDFEDAMQYYSALSEGCDVIITRNKKDFTESTISVMEPQEFLDMFYKDNNAT